MIRTILLCLSAFVVTGLSSCMSPQHSFTCQVSGEEFLVGSHTKSDVCARFQESLTKALDDGATLPQINLDIKKSGTIDVTVTDPNDSGADPSTTIPTISVDVMDRALSLRDIDSLAKALAIELNATKKS